MHDNTDALAFTISTIPLHMQVFENMEFESLSGRIQSRGFCFDERGPSNFERPGRLGCDTDHGKRVEEQTHSDDETPIQSNLWKPNNTIWIHSLTKSHEKQFYTFQPKAHLQPKTQNLNLASPNRMVENQPHLNTINQINTLPPDETETSHLTLAHISSTLSPSNRTLNIRFSQTQTLSSSSSEYQTPNPNSQLPTIKRFRKEFGKLKRNLRQRLLCGFFNREPMGGSETEGSNFLVTEDESGNENPVDMVLEGLREAVPQQLPHQP